MRTPLPVVKIDPAPPVAQPEDMVVLRIPRRTAEVLRTVLSFIGGPNSDGEPRTRLDQVHYALILAGVKSAASQVNVTASTSHGDHWPVGLRLGWKLGEPLIPSASVTGGLVTDWPSESREKSFLLRSLSRAESPSVREPMTTGPLGGGVNGRHDPDGQNTSAPAASASPDPSASKIDAATNTKQAISARARASAQTKSAQANTVIDSIAWSEAETRLRTLMDNSFLLNPFVYFGD